MSRACWPRRWSGTQLPSATMPCVPRIHSCRLCAARFWHATTQLFGAWARYASLRGRCGPANCHSTVINCIADAMFFVSFAPGKELKVHQLLLPEPASRSGSGFALLDFAKQRCSVYSVLTFPFLRCLEEVMQEFSSCLPWE